MNRHSQLAKELIQKVINETEQPQKEDLLKGPHIAIENAVLTNGGELLSGGWYYDVHGEHCCFIHKPSGQRLEVLLLYGTAVACFDPHFFYMFLESTASLKHLTAYFPSPFQDMYIFFVELVNIGVLVHLDRCNFYMPDKID